MKKILLFRIISIFFCTYSLVANSQTLLLPEENELILDVFHDDGLEIQKGLTVYQVNQKWFIPTVSLLDGLAIEFKYSLNLSKIDGTFLT